MKLPLALPKVGKIEIGGGAAGGGGGGVWVVSRQEVSPRDYRFARCGREMWERPSPLAGYFTTCGNLNGDGTFAYRTAGLPLTLQRLALLGMDTLRRPEDRGYAAGGPDGGAGGGG